MRKAAASSVLCLIVSFIGCVNSGQDVRPDSDYYPGSNWRTSAPEAQGIDSVWLQRMLNDIMENEIDVDSVLIVRHGYLVFESYMAPYTADTIHNIKSASKSVLSALAGIALEKKVLSGLDQKLSEVFPEYYESIDDPRKKEISLRNLLTMTAGFDWNENSPESDRLWRTEDWVGTVISTPLHDAPGETFTYSTALTHLMSAAITRKSGMSTQAFAQKHLFDPLGIKAKLWRCDPKGINFGGSDLFLTPQDMAKFGYLFLKGGSWNGREIVPREWGAESTRSQVKTNGYMGISDYGFWWWTLSGAYCALGYGGQMILIIPDHDLVVVFTCGGNDGLPLELYMKYIAPAIRSAALPPNSDAAKAIAALERKLESPQALPVPRLPGSAASISGKHYRLEPNPLGFTGFHINCEDARDCSVVFEAGELKILWPVGLDGRHKVSAPTAISDLPTACKGAWIDIDSAAPVFLMNMITVGEPVHLEVKFTFTGPDVTISATRRSRGETVLEMRGTEAPSP